MSTAAADAFTNFTNSLSKSLRNVSFTDLDSAHSTGASASIPESEPVPPAEQKDDDDTNNVDVKEEQAPLEPMGREGNL